VKQHGRFDTDSRALQERISAHDRFGAKDLNVWIFDQLSPARGHNVLDLGCGTGKQSLALADVVGDDGHVTSVDLSAASLGVLAEAAAAAGFNGRITAVHADLDEIPELLADVQVDRVVASYSLYYALDAERLIEFVSRALRPGGVFFFCGPTSANNGELRDFHRRLRVEGQPSRQADTGPPIGHKGADAGLFMEKTGPDAARSSFRTVALSDFENPLQFKSSDALYDYWRSYNLYDPSLDEAFRNAAKRHFTSHDVFTTVKRVVGVRASGGPQDPG